jgi:hypothetical protein
MLVVAMPTVKVIPTQATGSSGVLAPLRGAKPNEGFSDGKKEYTHIISEQGSGDICSSRLPFL